MQDIERDEGDGLPVGDKGYDLTTITSFVRFRAMVM